MYIDYRTRRKIETFEDTLVTLIKKNKALPHFVEEFEKYAFLSSKMGKLIGHKLLDVIDPGPTTINELVKREPEYWLKYIDDYGVLYKTTISSVVVRKPELFSKHKLPINKLDGYAFSSLVSHNRHVLDKNFDYFVTLDKATIRRVCLLYPKITKKFTVDHLEKSKITAKDFLLLITMNDEIFDLWDYMSSELYQYLKENITVDILTGKNKSSEYVRDALKYFGERIVDLDLK